MDVKLIIMLLAAAALGGCGRGTLDCGAEETLDAVTSLLLEETFNPAYRRKIRRGIIETNERELEAELEAVSAPILAAVRAKLPEDAKKHAVENAEYAALSKTGFSAVRDEMKAEMHRKIEEEIRRAESGGPVDAALVRLHYKVQLGFVTETGHFPTTDTYLCSAQVTSTLFPDTELNYTVKPGAKDGKFLVTLQRWRPG